MAERARKPTARKKPAKRKPAARRRAPKWEVGSAAPVESVVCERRDCENTATQIHPLDDGVEKLCDDHYFEAQRALDLPKLATSEFDGPYRNSG